MVAAWHMARDEARHTIAIDSSFCAHPSLLVDLRSALATTVTPSR
jgi:hypothetical protein